MATNPTASVQFLDGNLQQQINLAEEVVIKLGTATGGPFLTPVRVGSRNAVLRFLHGPVVRSGAHHCDYSGAHYLMRLRSSTPGTVGSVTKTPGTGVLASLGALTTSLITHTLHAQAAAGAALNLTTGWSPPGAPLPLKITLAGGGTAAHTQTVTGVDSAGNTVSEAVSITGVGTFTTTTEWASILSVTSNIDPGGTSDYTATWLGPGDRYNVVVTCISGGVLGVTGGTTPTYAVSYDGGRTTSRTYTMASTGIVDLVTYAGGLTPQYTGIRGTWSAGSLAQTLYGAIKVEGADNNGDMVFNMKSASASVTVVVAGMGTALSVGVVGSAVTINAATDGGGAVTTTAAQAVAAVAASAAAAALVEGQALGTGAGLLAAQGSTTNTTGGVVVTAKVEGVTYRQINAGASKSLSVSVVGKAVTLTVATDSLSLLSTTANAAVAALAANADAAALLSATVQGSGAGLVGCLTTYTSLPVSIATGDKFSFTTTPPAWTDADLQQGLDALLANQKWLGYASVVHVVGESTNSSNVILGTFIGNAASQRKQFKAAVVEGTYMGSTNETTWMNALISAFTTRSTAMGIAVGEADCANSAYGTVDRMNAATPYVARLMICPISELPSHVDCETILGTKQALDGVTERPGEGDQPLYQKDDTLVTLNTNNFITLRTHAGRSGVYVRQGLDFVDDGSDYTYVTNRRIANVAAALAYDEGLRFLNASMLLDPKTGQLAETECQKLESQVGGRLRKKLVSNDQGRQHCSSVGFDVDRGADFVSDGEVTGTISIVPRIPATTITLKVGFAPNTGATG